MERSIDGTLLSQKVVTHSGKYDMREIIWYIPVYTPSLIRKNF